MESKNIFLQNGKILYKNNSKFNIKSLKYKNVIGENIIFDICKNGTKEVGIFEIKYRYILEKDKYGNIL